MIVLDDDGPEHGTRQLVEGVGDDRIRYVRNRHRLGMSRNWNRCLELADTDLLTLLHYDDRLKPDYIRVMRETSAAYPTVASVHCGAEIIDETGSPQFSVVDAAKRAALSRRTTVLLEGEEGVRALMRGNFIMCPTSCFRRSRLPSVAFRDLQMVPDLDLFVRMLFEGLQLLVLPNVMYSYRRHNRSATELHTASLVRFIEEAQLHDEVAEMSEQRGWASAALVARRKRVVKANLFYRMSRDLIARRFPDARRKRRLLEQLIVKGSAVSRAERNDGRDAAGVP